MIGKKKYVILTFFLILSFQAKAQEKEKDKTLPKGNESFAEKKYNDAEADYRISQSKFPKKVISSYNLGNSIYRQKQSGEAKLQYAKSLKVAKTKTDKHSVYHNLGNCLMNDKDYQGAVEAYKNALRNNPNDEQTRYNYALAKKMLKENPPKKDDNKNKDKNKEKDKKDEKDKNKDKDKQDQKDQNKDQEDKNKEGDKDKDKKDNKNQNEEKPKPQPGGISKQRLDNMLDAVNNEEKKIQDKINKQKVKANPNKPEKDW